MSGSLTDTVSAKEFEDYKKRTKETIDKLKEQIHALEEALRGSRYICWHQGRIGAKGIV